MAERALQEDIIKKAIMDQASDGKALSYSDPNDPNAILLQVLKENVGLANTHSPENTMVMFASPERIKSVPSSYMLEYWPQYETGTDQLPHPNPGKTVLEIFDEKLKNNPELLKQAIYGDLIHGMKNDPNYAVMREQFKNSYTPQELERIKSKQSWWEDANGDNPNDVSIHDAYIRGFLNEQDVAMSGQKHYGGTMYSPQQLKILDQMRQYIKYGTR